MSDRTRIDWCDATINPWGWGCWGPGGSETAPQRCSYCFAARLADRKLRTCPDCQAFIPHWHPEELEKPLHWKRPRRIFVESMGDPFGNWVTVPQIEAVFNMMAGQSRHTFYLLTKQPENILHKLGAAGNVIGLQPHPNIWIGASVDTQARAAAAGEVMYDICDAGWHTFVSVEPMLTLIRPFSITWAHWVIVGAQTGRDAAKHAPQREWVEQIVEYGQFFHVPVFLKASITALWPDLRRREWPR